MVFCGPISPEETWRWFWRESLRHYKGNRLFTNNQGFLIKQVLRSNHEVCKEISSQRLPVQGQPVEDEAVGEPIKHHD